MGIAARSSLSRSCTSAAADARLGRLLDRELLADAVQGGEEQRRARLQRLRPELLLDREGCEVVGTAGTADFIRLAELASRQELDPFLQTWVYTPSKPTTW